MWYGKQDVLKKLDTDKTWTIHKPQSQDKLSSFVFSPLSLSFFRLKPNGGMPAATMFSKFKSGTATPQNPIDTNPIIQHFEIGKQTACAGPELVWKIHDAYKKSDGRVSIHSCIFCPFHFPNRRKFAYVNYVPIFSDFLLLKSTNHSRRFVLKQQQQQVPKRGIEFKVKYLPDECSINDAQ